jgi:hypothetical protein
MVSWNALCFLFVAVCLLGILAQLVLPLIRARQQIRQMAKFILLFQKSSPEVFWSRDLDQNCQSQLHCHVDDLMKEVAWAVEHIRPNGDICRKGAQLAKSK